MSDMVKAVRIHETGGPEALRWEDVEVGDPGPGGWRRNLLASSDRLRLHGEGYGPDVHNGA